LLLRYVEALGGGDVAETGRASREALALARTLGDRRGEAGALFGRAVSAMLAGDFADADADADSAAHLARAVDDVRVLARSLTLRGNTAMRRGDLDAALAHYTAALATTDDSVTVAKIASNAANVYERLGRLPEALVLYRRALGIVRAARDTASEALVLGNVGAVFTRLARDPGASGTRAESPVRAASAAARAPDRTAADSALGYAQRELALARALRDPSRIARAEDHVGAALAAAGRPARRSRRSRARRSGTRDSGSGPSAWRTCASRRRPTSRSASGPRRRRWRAPRWRWPTRWTRTRSVPRR
jgi:tetratricopeptide (TPR) repeat protein